MWKNEPPSLPGYRFHACLRACPRPSHEIGTVKLSNNILVIYAIRMRSTDGRTKFINELHSALSVDAPDAVLKALNHDLCEAYPDASHCAEVAVMLLNGSDHSLAISTAGDWLPELRTSNNEIVQLDRSKNGNPLGLVASIDYATQVVDLARNTTVFWMSPYTRQILGPSVRTVRNSSHT